MKSLFYFAKLLNGIHHSEAYACCEFEIIDVANEQYCIIGMVNDLTYFGVLQYLLSVRDTRRLIRLHLFEHF